MFRGHIEEILFELWLRGEGMAPVRVEIGRHGIPMDPNIGSATLWTLTFSELGSQQVNQPTGYVLTCYRGEDVSADITADLETL